MGDEMGGNGCPDDSHEDEASGDVIAPGTSSMSKAALDIIDMDFASNSARIKSGSEAVSTTTISNTVITTRQTLVSETQRAPLMAVQGTRPVIVPRLSPPLRPDMSPRRRKEVSISDLELPSVSGQDRERQHNLPKQPHAARRFYYRPLHERLDSSDDSREGVVDGNGGSSSCLVEMLESNNKAGRRSLPIPLHNFGLPLPGALQEARAASEAKQRVSLYVCDSEVDASILRRARCLRPLTSPKAMPPPSHHQMHSALQQQQASPRHPGPPTLAEVRLDLDRTRHMLQASDAGGAALLAVIAPLQRVKEEQHSPTDTDADAPLSPRAVLAMGVVNMSTHLPDSNGGSGKQKDGRADGYKSKGLSRTSPRLAPKSHRDLSKPATTTQPLHKLTSLPMADDFLLLQTHHQPNNNSINNNNEAGTYAWHMSYRHIGRGGGGHVNMHNKGLDRSSAKWDGRQRIGSYIVNARALSMSMS